MNLFNLSTGPLLAILLLMATVFVVSMLLSREQNSQSKLLGCAAITFATFFSIEAYVVTVGLIPPQSYVLGEVGVNGHSVINDWVSSAGVNMGDLFIAWILVFSALSALHFVKRQSNRSHNQALGKTFYNNFGSTAAIAVVLTSMLYVFVVIPGYFDSNILLLDKILFRGPIPYITLGLFVWVILNVMLLTRRMVFQRQQDVLIENILTSDSEKKQAQLNSISPYAVLKRRLLDINHGANDSSREHLTQLVDQQSAMEREDVTVSILYLHTAMWAIPVLGFLGTVWGIAEAVANLIPLLKGLSASELGGSQLADSLAGLGVAFDTTLVALSLSLPAMALISLLEKAAHEDMLVRDRILLRHAKDWV